MPNTLRELAGVAVVALVFGAAAAVIDWRRGELDALRDEWSPLADALRALGRAARGGPRHGR